MKESLRLKRLRAPAPAFACAVALALVGSLVCACIVGASGMQAWAATYKTTVVEVSDSEFNPEGYDWSLNFSSVANVSGWTYVSKGELAKYYAATNRSPSNIAEGVAWNYLVTDNDDGYMVAIDGSTKTGQKLRLKGGTYITPEGGSVAIDMVVTLVSWTYTDPSAHAAGFDFEKFQPGVYYNPNYDPYGTSSGAITNMNFYTVGLEDLEVEIDYYKAGTSTKLDVSGHMTCTDLDVCQKFGFGGAVSKAMIAQDNENLTIEKSTNLIASSSIAISDANTDDQYKYGLVSCLFDYATTGNPVQIKFVTSYNNENYIAAYKTDNDDATGNIISFFALTNEFLTASENPPSDPEKTVDVTSGAQVGDTLTYSIKAQVHQRGVDCRADYSYTSFSFVDSLPTDVKYISSSAYLTDEDGNRQSGAGTANYDTATNTLTYTLNSTFLENMAMEGECYILTFEVRIVGYPDDGSLTITNQAYTRINNSSINYTGEVTTELEPLALAISKSASPTTAHAGDVVRFTVVVSNPDTEATLRNVVMTDSFGTTYGSVMNDTLTCSKAGYVDNSSGNSLSIALGSLAPRESATIVFDVTLSESLHANTEIHNTAYANASNADQVEDSASVTIIGTPALSIEKQASASTVNAGQNVTYTVTVTSTGTADAGHVVIKDTLPDELNYVANSLTCDDATATLVANGNALSVSVPQLDRGESVTLAYTATVVSYAGETIVNTATASADDVDEVSDDAQISPVWDALPEAGGPGEGLLVKAGGALALAACIAWWARRRLPEGR